jgi:hypothetical protein
MGRQLSGAAERIGPKERVCKMKTAIYPMNKRDRDGNLPNLTRIARIPESVKRFSDSRSDPCLTFCGGTILGKITGRAETVYLPRCVCL